MKYNMFKFNQRCLLLNKAVFCIYLDYGFASIGLSSAINFYA
jgi:hypothetical protein